MRKSVYIWLIILYTKKYLTIEVSLILFDIGMDFQ